MANVWTSNLSAQELIEKIKEELSSSDLTFSIGKWSFIGLPGNYKIIYEKRTRHGERTKFSLDIVFEEFKTGTVIKAKVSPSLYAKYIFISIFFIYVFT